MVNLIAERVDTHEFSSLHFGGNILANRDRVGPEGTFDDVADALGIDFIRYPGGSLTEYYFDIANPDRSQTIDPNTGAVVDLLPYSEFMGYAEATGKSVAIVIPTREFLSVETDVHGDRFAQIDEDILRGFVRDTLDGVYGSPRIQAFEIGNEYWGSGEMSAVEYGRLASLMATIVDDELHAHPDFQTEFADTDILVQMGTNYDASKLSNDFATLGNGAQQLDALNADYNTNFGNDFLFSNGTVNWTKVNNELIIREFDMPVERAAVDAVVAHVYSKAPISDNSRYFELTTINETWGEKFDNITTYVTEWNQSASSAVFDRKTDFGLKQAHEMINMAETMALNNVEAAHIWAVQQRTPSSLSGNEGQTELRVPGEMFRMMSENLRGLRVVDLVEGSGSKETEASDTNADIHVFYGHGRMVTYIASTSDQNSISNVEFGGLVSDLGSVEITRLGVADGNNPGAPNATAVVSSVDPSQAFDGTSLSAELRPYEILQIVFDAPTLAPEFAGAAVETAENSPGPGLEEFAPYEMVDETYGIPEPRSAEELIHEQPGTATESAQIEEAPEEPDGLEELVSGADFGGLGFLAMLLPLLMFL